MKLTLVFYLKTKKQTHSRFVFTGQVVANQMLLGLRVMADIHHPLFDIYLYTIEGRKGGRLSIKKHNFLLQNRTST
jgi:hypothetical protein